ncbi:MAG: cation:proton antiporter, partial [Leptospiraceae bacterium]|nr:cation:proton antiporter [Leptospiraceae bacterium]
KIPMPELSLLLWLGLLVGFLLISRPLIIYPLVRLGGGSDRTAFLSSVNLLQFSEFSLVIGAMGLELGHIDRSLFSALLYGLVLTSILSSYGIKYSHWVYRFWQRLLPAAVSSPVPPGADASGSQSESETSTGEERTIFILGYHRGAQSMVANLLQHRPEVLERITVVDFNAEVLQQLQHTPVKGVFGDLSDRSTLEHVGMQKAR